MKPVEKVLERKAYFLPCKVCGKEVEVGETTFEVTCYECSVKRRRQAAEERLSYLIGAMITSIEPNDSIGDLDSLTVKATNGKFYYLKVGGYDEHWIDVEEATV